jgi:hypothetical protein
MPADTQHLSLVRQGATDGLRRRRATVRFVIASQLSDTLWAVVVGALLTGVIGVGDRGSPIAADERRRSRRGRTRRLIV